MRSLLVVATTLRNSVNRFHTGSMREAANIKDFLEQTGEYRGVGIYELEKAVGPLRQWTELKESSP